MNSIDNLIIAMMEYDCGDAKRIQHFLKVFEFSHIIGVMEKLDEKTQLILEAAAVVHDIGIHNAEKKYGSCSGKYQEIEGPAEALLLLEELGFSSETAERVTFLVGHHHSYSNVDGIDYQILIEADFLVNLFEDACSDEAIKNVLMNIFKTESGKKLFYMNYGTAL